MGRSQQININEKQKRQTIAYAIWGGITIAAVLIITTLWISKSARIGTDQAVSRVSEFYLDELAGRRARVVSEELNNNFRHIEKALDVLEDSDLESEETLRSFLGNTRRLFGVDKFAMVDEDGIVYAQHSTTSGLSRYAFLAEELTEPVISTANLYGAKKQVILAMPVEGIYFQGRQIKVCFIQINIADMLSSLTLQASDNETYCNLYYRNGESLTNDDFGYLTAGKNVLSALEEAVMEKETDYQKLKEDFANGSRGQISFTYSDTAEDLCYVPVEGTDWMLTILIRNNVISDQISSISEEMMHNGIVQIVITVVAMLVVFLGIIYQSRRNSRILLEQEKADGKRIRAAYAMIEREQTDMENIHTAMGSGRWSMEFDEKAEMISCTWTDAFREMIGYESKADFPDKLESWSDLLHKEDKAWVLKEYWDTVKDYTGKKTYDVEYRLLTRHGGWRWFHAAGRLSRREDGSPITFIGLFVDIDDEKRMEEQLEKQKTNLQDALAAAQHANKAKTTFLNNMSHDIRTPMNAIIGFTSLAAAHIDNTEQVQDYLAKITTSSNHLLSLINDVLDMSRIESGKMNLVIEDFDLKELIDEAAAIFQTKVEEKHQHFELAMNIEHRKVMGDYLSLQKVFHNILGNAVKYTQKEGNVAFRVEELPSLHQNYGYYRFVIEDNGYGMSEEFQKNLFEPFERSGDPRVESLEGTGLGMTIAWNLVQLMQGDIQVESELNKGSKFIITLFLPLQDEMQDSSEDDPEAGEENASFPGKRVLLVEDNELNIEIAMEILQMFELEVTLAYNGKEAVDLYRKQEEGYFDIVFMDIQMPVMDGYTAAREIRSSSRKDSDRIPIVAMTANAFSEDVQKAIHTGMNDHVAKPIDLRLLVKVLTKWLA